MYLLVSELVWYQFVWFLFLELTPAEQKSTLEMTNNPYTFIGSGFRFCSVLSNSYLTLIRAWGLVLRLSVVLTQAW